MTNCKCTVTALLIVLGPLVGNNSTAQSFLGLSINYGDKLTFNPEYPSLFLERRSFSPTVVYSRQAKFQSGFSMMYGAQVGIAGYQLVPEYGDTLSVGGVDKYPFSYYGIIVGRLELTPGKVFHVRKKELFVGIGGGASYYFFLFPDASMGVDMATDQGGSIETFSASIESSESGVFAAFAKVYAKINLSPRFDIAFQYSRHWKSILTGEFEFSHTATPASGTIKLVPQGISLQLLYRLGSGSNEAPRQRIVEVQPKEGHRAQNFLGLSINYGDKLTYTPEYPSLLLDRRSISPTIVYSRQTNFRSGFSMIYGAQAGVAGYQLVPVPGDTISGDIQKFPIGDYGILVGRLEFAAGKVFQVSKTELFVGLGGGASYYFFLSPSTSMTVHVRDKSGGGGARVFSAHIESPESGVFAAFAKVYAKINLSPRIDLAFQYSRHWKSILTGDFEFHHTATPASGTIKLVPQGISVMLLRRLGRAPDG
jgi:hypothetical protein